MVHCVRCWCSYWSPSVPFDALGWIEWAQQMYLMTITLDCFRGVIHQLCRVLVLLHKKDTGTSIPSDALGLIEWAQQMLEDHRQQQEVEALWFLWFWFSLCFSFLKLS